MTEAAEASAGAQHRPALATGFLAAAGIAWPAAAILLGTLAAWATISDLQRLLVLDRTLVPEGWTGSAFRISLSSAGIPLDLYAWTLAGAKLLMLSAFFAVALVAWRRRRVDAGALVVAYFLVAFASNWQVEPSRMPGWIGPDLEVISLVAWAAFLNFFLLFPDNRYRPAWTVWLGVGVPLLAAAAELLNLFPQVRVIAFALTLVMAAGLQYLKYRRHSGPVQRQQSRWLLVGFGSTTALVLVALIAGAALNPAPRSQGALALEVFGQAVGQVAFIPIPLALGVALTRHRLWDMDRVLNRALVYGILTVAIVAVYLVVAVLVASRLSAGSGPLVTVGAALLVAVLLQPARARLQLALNRRTYGSRDDPYAALTRLGRRLEDRVAFDRVIPLIAHTVRESTRSPLVEISVHSAPDLAVVVGDPSLRETASAVSLGHQGQIVGEMRVAPRSGEDRLSRSDQALLEDLRPHAGQAVGEVLLQRQLLASRESLVVAREEERRRLSQILHDDVGATLAAQKLRAGAAAASLETDPGAAQAQLKALEAELGLAIGRLRQLAYELRPPALEELGLREAVAEVLRQQPAGTFFELRAGTDLPALRPALELSLYRFVEQAAANVVLHAQARRCTVELRVDHERAMVAVSDDGVGPGPGLRLGVGLSSMRQRTEELGGAFSLVAQPGGGTRVQAVFPIGARS